MEREGELEKLRRKNSRKKRIFLKNFQKNTRYVDENTVNFVVMNKVGGFLQRIDYARKYAFGAMCILKDDKGQFPIRGAWIFRGQAIPPMMVEVREIF